MRRYNKIFIELTTIVLIIMYMIIMIIVSIILIIMPHIVALFFFLTKKLIGQLSNMKLFIILISVDILMFSIESFK